MQVIRFTFNDFGECTYLVVDSATRQALVVDPGMSREDEREAFDAYIAKNNLTITQIVNTHMHVDHCFGADYVRRRYGVKLAAHPGDAPLAALLKQQAMRFGQRTPIDDISIDVDLTDGDIIELGSGRLRVIHVPGHSPGGIALYDEADHWLISGDSLFQGSIGRTDLPGGDYATLVKAVRHKLLSLPDDTVVYPGHGPATTIGQEKQYNPFL